MYYILYNPLSKSGKNQKHINKLQRILLQKGEEMCIKNILEIEDMKDFVKNVGDDSIIIVGGDGTMHYVANFLHEQYINNKIYFYSAGTGNDFIRNIESKNEFECINSHLENLPTVKCNNEKHVFINGVGLGLDAYVCKSVNNGEGKSAIQYKIRTIYAFLTCKKYKLKITVDGKVYQYSDVWLTSVMNGKHQGGGMKFAPKAIMNDGILNVCMVRKFSRLKLLLVFPFIFKGRHERFTKGVKTFIGKEIVIETETPQVFQMDGEVINNVSKIIVNG